MFLVVQYKFLTLLWCPKKPSLSISGGIGCISLAKNITKLANVYKDSLSFEVFLLTKDESLVLLEKFPKT